MASVGPLLVPGRSKNARTSAARLTRVLPSVMTSTNGFGTPELIESISSVISFFPVARSGCRYAAIIR